MRTFLRHNPNRLGSIRRLAAACALPILLFGCQSIETGGRISSNAPPDISGPAAGAIAGDMVSRLVQQIGQGKATVALTGARGGIEGMGIRCRDRSELGRTYTVMTSEATPASALSLMQRG